MQGTILQSVKDLIMTKMVMASLDKIYYFFPKKTKGPHIFCRNSLEVHAAVNILLCTSSLAKILRMMKILPIL